MEIGFLKNGQKRTCHEKPIQYIVVLQLVKHKILIIIKK